MSKVKTQMPNQIQNQNNKKKVYNLEERTALFGEEIIVFVKKLPLTVVTRPLISQLIRSATSVGANYMEADAASTSLAPKDQPLPSILITSLNLASWMKIQLVPFWNILQKTEKPIRPSFII